MSADDHAAASGPGATDEPALMRGDMQLVAAERVVFFSDAVVAIAITLLALDLHLPTGNSNLAVLHDLRVHYLNYPAFFVNFLVIANHWRAHHRLFNDVVRLDQRSITLDFGWLLMIIVTPFATRILTSRGTAFGIQFTIYSVVQILTVLFFVLLTRHLRRQNLLQAQAGSLLATDHELNQIVIAAMFALSIPVAFFTPWAFAFWAASGLVARRVQLRLGQSGRRP
jgi:TMEM175 potassium channel family protein